MVHPLVPGNSIVEQMIKWTFVFITLSSLVFGQEVTINQAGSQPITLESGFKLQFVSGNNQYLMSHWAKGKLYYANNTSNAYDSLNFDRYGNAIEVIIHDKPLTVYPMGLAGALIHTGENSGYVLIKGELDGEQKMLEVLSSGKYVLAKYLEVNEVPSSQIVKTDEFRFVPKPEAPVNISIVFYVWDSGAWNEFRLNKSSIGKLFKVDKKEIQNFSYENHLNISNAKDLIQLFHYFNNAH